MKASDLPERYKQYIVSITNNSKCHVNGETMKNILNSKSQLVELADGNGFNKACIIEWRLDEQLTSDQFKALPDEEKQLIIEEVKILKVRK